MRTQEIESFADESEIIEEPKPRKSMLLVSWLIYFSYLPLGVLLGIVRLELGLRVRGMTAFDPLIYSVFFFGLLHTALIWPITTLAYPQIKKFAWRWARVMVLALLVAPPLISYGYYRDGMRDIVGVYEVLLMVVPPALLGAIAYERFEKAWLFTLFLGVPSFVSFFVLAEMLSSFSTYFSYQAMGSAFYLLQAAAALGTLGFVVLSLSGYRPATPAEGS